MLTRPAPGYLRATFDHPPMNFLTPATVGELREVLSEAQDGTTRVIVFDSADPDFFMARYDLASRSRTGSPIAGLHEFAQITAALAQSSVISIAAVGVAPRSCIRAAPYAEAIRSRRADSSRREWTWSFRNTFRRW
jgi:enoyl-CoA hydratase/carnithine racemase